jgi:hypothetical protein
MRLEQLKQHPVAVLAALGVALGLLAGLARGPKAPADTGPIAEAAWSLPSVTGTARGDDKAFAAVQRSPWWRSAAQTNARKAPKWKIVGVTAEGETRTALILVAGSKEILRVGNGDALPGGGQVIDVGRYGMRVSIYGCDIILRLYTPGERSPSPNCQQQTGSATGDANVAAPQAAAPAKAGARRVPPAGKTAKAATADNSGTPNQPAMIPSTPTRAPKPAPN